VALLINCYPESLYPLRFRGGHMASTCVVEKNRTFFAPHRFTSAWTEKIPNASTKPYILAYKAGGVTQTFTYVASGGITTGGSAIVSKTKNFVAAGGIVTGGAALATKTKDYLTSGGIAIGGIALYSETDVYVASGGIITGGAALLEKVKNYVASGGLVTDSAATVSKTKDFITSGGLATSGAALVAKVKDFIASGGIATGGSAAYTETDTYVASGGIVTSGSALISIIKIPSIDGGISVSGSSVTQYVPGVEEPPLIPTVGGPFFVERRKRKPKVFSYVASGGIVIGGSAKTSYVAVKSYIAEIRIGKFGLRSKHSFTRVKIYQHYSHSRNRLTGKARYNFVPVQIFNQEVFKAYQVSGQAESSFVKYEPKVVFDELEELLELGLLIGRRG
jgi:hypothetical protein